MGVSFMRVSFRAGCFRAFCLGQEPGELPEQLGDPGGAVAAAATSPRVEGTAVRGYGEAAVENALHELVSGPW
jgi:hypothetical protein